MNLMLYLKSLHIIFVVTWFAGLFYIVRLFIYDVEVRTRPDAERLILLEQLRIMQRRLWYGITWPSAIMTLILGPSLLVTFWSPDQVWIWAKLAFVLGLYIYHSICGKIYRDLRADRVLWTSTQLRVWNEVATVFLFAIVFLVVLKNSLEAAKAFAGLIALSVLLFIGISFFKKRRG